MLPPASEPKGIDKGFTLVELMMVMLLITIVLAVAMPRFEGGVFEDPTNKLSRWMINNVRTLRSQAVQQQTIKTLVVDLDNHKLWVASDDMDPEATGAPGPKALVLPDDIRIVDLQFPASESITSGTAQINFYPAGFSDHALLHLENDAAERFCYHVQPLLPKVKFIQGWIDF